MRWESLVRNVRGVGDRASAAGPSPLGAATRSTVLLLTLLAACVGSAPDASTSASAGAAGAQAASGAAGAGGGGGAASGGKAGGGGSSTAGSAGMSGAAGSVAGAAGASGSAGAAAGNGGTSGAAATAGAAGASCKATPSVGVHPVGPVDLVFVVDTSGSMTTETAGLEPNLVGVVSALASQDADPRVILVGAEKNAATMQGICISAPLGSGTCPKDQNAPGYLHLAQPIGSDILPKIDTTFATWAPQLRAGAVQFLIAVSDDDPVQDPYDPAKVGGAAAAADKWLAAMKSAHAAFDGMRVGAMYPFSMCGTAAHVGTVWAALADKTGGPKVDLCQTDFKKMTDDLGAKLSTAAIRSCAWKVPLLPGVPFEPTATNLVASPPGMAKQTIPHVADAAACGATGGWYFDPPTAPKTLVACPTTCSGVAADKGTVIDVELGCPTLDL